MKVIPTLLGTALLLLLATSGCDTDNCVDVECAPAPPPLTVLVKDSATSTRFVTDAEVTLWRVSGADTVALDTLLLSDSSYVLNDASGVPNAPLLVRAMRGQRCGKQSGLQLRMVEGCCGYPIVGRVTVVLVDSCG